MYKGFFLLCSVRFKLTLLVSLAPKSWQELGGMDEPGGRVAKRPRLQDPPAAASDADSEARRDAAVAEVADAYEREAEEDQEQVVESKGGSVFLCFVLFCLIFILCFYVESESWFYFPGYCPFSTWNALTQDQSPSTAKPPSTISRSQVSNNTPQSLTVIPFGCLRVSLYS